MRTNPTHKNIFYGELVEVAGLTGEKRGHRSFDTGGYHSGVKVHYFNKKGVFLGNIYEFVPYEYVRFRKSGKPFWPRYFMLTKRSELGEWMASKIFEFKCRLVTLLMRNSYKD